MAMKIPIKVLSGKSYLQVIRLFTSRCDELIDRHREAYLWFHKRDYACRVRCRSWPGEPRCGNLLDGFNG